jgi:excisionase family DNA binding protein
MFEHDFAAANTGAEREDVSTGFGLMTAADVAIALQVPESWVYAEARAGRIPHVTLGRYRRFRPDALAAWIAERERGSESIPTRPGSYRPLSAPSVSVAR